MSRISETFATVKSENRAAFIPFVMAGDPDAATTLKILSTLAENGADIIELGIPFSDPMADGPVIQAAGLRALAGGMTLKSVLKTVTDFRALHATTPLVLMGYLNPVYVYGYESFARDAAAAGVDGIIIVDAPPEEAGEIEPVLSAQGIDFVRLIAPTSVPARLPLLAKNAGGYLYYISITGITGAGAAPAKNIAASVAEIRKHTSLPVCVGFGIKTTEDVRAMAPLADGVVVGSALVKLIHDSGADLEKIATFTKQLSPACSR